MIIKNPKNNVIEIIDDEKIGYKANSVKRKRRERKKTQSLKIKDIYLDTE